MKKIAAQVGIPEAVIAHSFGGGASLFAAVEGFPMKKLITIASPTIGDEIIHTYMTTLGATESTRKAFKEAVIKRYGKPFEEYTALRLIHQLPHPINLMMVSDTDDREVPVNHAHAMKKEYPAVQLHITSGLGHNRILKDNGVINYILQYIGQQP
jgi:predicted alpha/beta hydrolase family esterase